MYTIPTHEELQQMLTNLLDLPVEVKQLSDTRKFDPPALLSTFCDEEGTVRVACHSELAFANSVAGALSRIPKGLVDEQIKSGTCPDNLFENFAEVMNISTNLFTSPSADRLHLRETRKEPLEDLPENMAASKGTQYEVSIQGYGTGNVSIAAC